MVRNFISAVVLSFLATAAYAGRVTASAENTVGISFGADAAAASSNPDIASNPSLKMAVTTGDDLFAGNRILIGNFTLTDSDVQAHAGDVTFLFNHFTLYGTAQIGDSYSGAAGIFSRTITNSADSLGLSGKQIQMFVLGATDNSSLAQSVATAFQIGVFYFDFSQDADWAFKPENPPPNTSIIDLADLTIGGNGNALVPTYAHVVVGALGSDSPNNLPAGSGHNFSLSAVPEPTTGILAVSSSALIVGFRRIRLRCSRS